MAAKIYWIQTFENNASLGIMARPRSGDWLQGELLSVKQQGVDTVVSLLQATEVHELELDKEADICKQLGLYFISFPIPDRDIPPKSIKTNQFILQLKNGILSGKKIVIHCRMGIGRSAIVAGAVMISLGESCDNIVRTISLARGLKVPDTIEQEKWLIKEDFKNIS